MNVIEVGASGTHNVCVCEKHENVRLMIDFICGRIDEKYYIMEKLVCDVKNSFCMLNRCPNCQGRQKLSDHITTYLDSVNTVKFE